MKDQKKSEIVEKINELQKNIRDLGPVMRGSVTIMGKRHKQPYFSVGIQKKTKDIYLGKKREGKAREYLENYKRLMQIVDEMTLLNMELLKLDVDG